MGKSAHAPSMFVLETAPPSMITVHRRQSSEKKLDTIVEESNCLTYNSESEMAVSFGSMSLNWSNDRDATLNGHHQSHNQRYYPKYMICSQ